MFMLIVGAMIFGHFMSATTVTNSLVIWVQNAGLSSVGIIVFVSVIFFILGCFIDITPLLVLLVPLFYPLILESGADPIWFGVVVVTLCMIGIITPPVGAVLFVTKGLDEEASIGMVYKGALVFLIPMLIGLAIIVAFPQVSTFLPSLIEY
jgi:C4-dicarboxylate transporter DctM subunit